MPQHSSMTIYTPIRQPNPDMQRKLAGHPLPTYQKGEILTAEKLTGVANQVNTLSSIVGGNRQLRKPPVTHPGVGLELAPQVRFNQGSIDNELKHFGPRWQVLRNMVFTHAYLHFVSGTFEVQININGTLTGPVITEADATSNPIDLQATGDETDPWLDGEYISLYVSDQVAAQSFDLVLLGVTTPV